MARPKGKWAGGRACSVCRHEQRGRIDYLIVTGAGEHGGGRRALAEKFSLSESAVYNHSTKHISAEYKKAVLVGPFASEDALREICAQEGVSALQNYRALFNGHRSRWARALEVGDDDAMVKHGRAMDGMLWRIAQVSREVMPNAPAIQQNVFMSPDYYNFERRALRVLRRHPEALQDWLAEFRERPALMIESDAA
jgi:hypothetical protein